MIEHEDDVRAWVREASGGKARWVEPAMGSTPGLPDCWVPYDELQIHLELKVATLSRGIIKYGVRPEQRRQILAMMDDGVKVGLVVGVKGSSAILFLLPTPQALNGIVSLVDENQFGDRVECYQDSPSTFWSGVNFIFSENWK